MPRMQKFSIFFILGPLVGALSAPRGVISERSLSLRRDIRLGSTAVDVPFSSENIPSAPPKNKNFLEKLLGPPPEPEPPMPADKDLVILANQFKPSRALARNFFMLQVALDFMKGIKGFETAGDVARPWFWTSKTFSRITAISYLTCNHVCLSVTLVSPVFDHLGKSCKRGNMLNPEVKILNAGVTASCVLLAVATAATALLGRPNLNPVVAAVAQAFAGASVPLGMVAAIAFPCFKAVMMYGTKGCFDRGFEGLNPFKTPAPGSTVSILATVYGVLAIEAVVTAVAKPYSLPFMRAAACYVLHLQTIDNDENVLASDFFKLLNEGLMYSTFGSWGSSTGLLSKVFPAMAIAAAFFGQGKSKDARASKEAKALQ